MRPEDLHSKRILLSALNWGSGHLARCLPLIHQLQEQGNVVLIAASEEQRRIFSCYFPSNEYIEHEPYPFVFGGKGRFALDLWKNRKALQARLKAEKREVEDMIVQHKIELVLSDHRYGFCTSKVPSVFITHQLNLPISDLFFWVQNWHHRLIRRFDYVWVLDREDHFFAGKMSVNRKGFPAVYIGPRSRFQLYSLDGREKKGSVVVASGPDVYARVFLQEHSALIENGCEFVAPEHLATAYQREVSVNWRELDQILLRAEKVVARCGYSTLMDLHFLNIESELSPTPGQHEQIYLHKILRSRDN